MRLLIDTDIALWATLSTKHLPMKAKAMIGSATNEIFVSAVSVWEIAIKHALKRGRPDDMPLSGTDACALFEQAGYTILPMNARHAAAVNDLPLHHTDPFDRMLVAQAIVEPLRLVTRDARLAAYDGVVMVV